MNQPTLNKLAAGARKLIVGQSWGPYLEGVLHTTTKEMLERLGQAKHMERACELIYRALHHHQKISIAIPPGDTYERVFLGQKRVSGLGPSCAEVLKGWIAEWEGRPAIADKEQPAPVSTGYGDKYLYLGSVLNNPASTMQEVVRAGLACGLMIRFVPVERKD